MTSSNDILSTDNNDVLSNIKTIASIDSKFLEEKEFNILKDLVSKLTQNYADMIFNKFVIPYCDKYGVKFFVNKRDPELAVVRLHHIDDSRIDDSRENLFQKEYKRKLIYTYSRYVFNDHNRLCFYMKDYDPCL